MKRTIRAEWEVVRTALLELLSPETSEARDLARTLVVALGDAEGHARWHANRVDETGIASVYLADGRRYAKAAALILERETSIQNRRRNGPRSS